MSETKIYPNTLKKHEREQHRAAIERSTRFDHIPHERQLTVEELLELVSA